MTKKYIPLDQHSLSVLIHFTLSYTFFLSKIWNNIKIKVYNFKIKEIANKKKRFVSFFIIILAKQSNGKF